MLKTSILSVFFLLVTSVIFAQNSEPAMADALHENGKIYVVVIVLATIFAGIIAYLVRLDRKISKLDKNK
jgi:hypothetical protein